MVTPDNHQADIYTHVPLDPREKRLMETEARFANHTGRAPDPEETARRLPGSPQPQTVKRIEQGIRAGTTTTNLRNGQTTQGMSPARFRNEVDNLARIIYAEKMTRRTGQQVVPEIKVNGKG